MSTAWDISSENPSRAFVDKIQSIWVRCISYWRQRIIVAVKTEQSCHQHSWLKTPMNQNVSAWGEAAAPRRRRWSDCSGTPGSMDANTDPWNRGRVLPSCAPPRVPRLLASGSAEDTANASQCTSTFMSPEHRIINSCAIKSVLASKIHTLFFCYLNQ